MIPGSRDTVLIKKKTLVNFTWRWLAFLAGPLLFSACENDMKAIRKISAQEVSKPISTTTGVDVIYSDSAKVQFHLTAPLMLDYMEKRFQETPKGVKIVRYEKNTRGEVVQSGQITADYAIMRENDRIIEFRRNVVATNIKGETFKSDELIWDQGKKLLTTNKPVRLSFADGTVFYGTGANTNESMYPWNIENTTGQIPVNQNFGQ
jgi:LPS export ABC transporter protein LptC